MQFLTIGILCNAYSEDRINKSLVSTTKTVNYSNYKILGGTRSFGRL